MALAYEDGRFIVDAYRHVHYEVVPRRGILDAPPYDLLSREGVGSRLVVIDARVDEIYGTRIRHMLEALDGKTSYLTLPASESAKERPAVDEIHKKALATEIARRDELIGIGGGVLLDLVGVAAAELRRETPYAVIPTTLVGQVDAAVGGKRTINFRWQTDSGEEVKKSYIGDYHPARLSIVDPDFLLTLPSDEIRAGLAEIKKVGEMVDSDLIALLEQHGQRLIDGNFASEIGDGVIRRAIRGILTQLANDLWEDNLMRWPDYGHSVSGALEMETGMAHGFAVSACTCLAAAIAFGRDLITKPELGRMLGLAAQLGLPTWHPHLANRDFLQKAMASTALLRGGRHWPVPTGIGRYTFVEPSISETLRAANLLRNWVGA